MHFVASLHLKGQFDDTMIQQWNPHFHAVLSAFKELTDCPMVINTSFNIRGEPIVCTPEHAFRCFMATDMEALVLEDFLLLKDRQPAGLLEDAQDYRAQYKLD